MYSSLVLSIYFLKIYLFIFRERERERDHGEAQGEGERISSRLPAQHKAQLGAQSHNPETLTRAEIKSQRLNRLRPRHPEDV